MGRARGHHTAITDAFNDVLGARRGQHVNERAALAALDEGRYQPALNIIAAGADRDGELTDALARRLAYELHGTAATMVVEPLRRIGALRDGPDGPLPILDDELFAQDAVQVSRDALGRARANAMTPADALGDCEAAIIAAAQDLAADYLRRGGARHLQHLFGATAWRGIRRRLSDRTAISPGSGALSSLLVAAVDRSVVAALCAGETADQTLVERAAQRYNTPRGPAGT